jgi:nucleotide-binding universal stress UspA family protein
MKSQWSIEAAADFKRARRRADLREVLSALGARRSPLLSYDDVRRRLHAVESPASYLEDVPLDAIVGSVGRTVDFTREFLPRTDADKARWVGVKVAMTGLTGTPPVELYRIGDAYFVRDGNHRVSVARQLGARFIQAYVTPVHARVPLSADVSPDDLIIAEEHARFLESTALDELRPDADLRVTTAGAFERLLDHISVHRYYMGIDEDREVAYPEAVAHWYDTVYLPVREAIRSGGVLRGFPGRTETDLYLWLSEHRGRLERELGFTLPSESIAESIGAGGAGGGGGGGAERLGVKERDDLLKQVHERGEGRQSDEGSIADDLLVALPDLELGLPALEQALLIADRESARVYALHVAADEDAAAGEDVAALRAAAMAAAGRAGVELQFAVALGNPAQELRERAAWVDLLVAPMIVQDTKGWRLSPRHQGLLRRTPCPILVTVGPVRAMERALVAYDGGARADEALFVAAYAAGKWGTEVVVATVAETSRGASAVLDKARSYLERYGVRADYVERQGPVAETLIAVADERACDIVLMGSYRYSRWLESLLGGVLERTLRAAGRPVMVL